MNGESGSSLYGLGFAQPGYTSSTGKLSPVSHADGHDQDPMGYAPAAAMLGALCCNHMLYEALEVEPSVLYLQ